jgi:tetratricopeptide (TPR) repeat protein
MVLAELARYAEAESCYEEALRLRPGFADAHANFGNWYKEQGRLEEAVASYGINPAALSGVALGSWLWSFDGIGASSKSSGVKIQTPYTGWASSSRTYCRSSASA